MSTPPERFRSSYERHGEKARFLLAGVWNTAFSYALFIVVLSATRMPLASLANSDVRLLAWAGEHSYLIAQWLAWTISVVQSTAVMKYVVFHSAGRLWPQVSRAYLVYLPAQGISTLLLWLTVEVLTMPPELGQLVTIVVTVVFSYFGHKYFTFRMPLEAIGVLQDDLLTAEEPES